MAGKPRALRRGINTLSTVTGHVGLSGWLCRVTQQRGLATWQSDRDGKSGGRPLQGNSDNVTPIQGSNVQADGRDAEAEDIYQEGYEHGRAGKQMCGVPYGSDADKHYEWLRGWHVGSSEYHGGKE